MSDDLDTHPLARLPLEIVVSVGTAKGRLADLLKLSDDATFVLDRGVDDPVDILVGGQLVARGALEEKDEDGHASLSVRITEIVAAAPRRNP